MNLTKAKQFLREEIAKESKELFGINSLELINQITENWFNDQENYDKRWLIIREKLPKVGKVLDMAAGCGTFVLYGLHQGYDVWGVEPEAWKLNYLSQKIDASCYPEFFKKHLIEGYGESLPFENNTFDLVTTYQTLEHVDNVKACLLEMLRVLKPGGVLYIKCPDYNCFFEPHYRVPFLPQMNKQIAGVYLTYVLKRPTAGLYTLNWTTRQKIIRIIKQSSFKVIIEDTDTQAICQRINQKFPFVNNYSLNLKFLADDYLKFKRVKKSIKKVFKEESQIDLWITKL